MKFENAQFYLMKELLESPKKIKNNSSFKKLYGLFI